MNSTTSNDRDAIALYHRIRAQEEPDPRLTTELNAIISTRLATCSTQNKGHYINRLPLELLSLIFQKAAEDDPATPLILFLVSQTWRRLAEQEPRLWSTIILDDSQPDFVEVAAVRVHFSKRAPLAVKITNGRLRLLHVIDHLFEDHLDRIEDFEWTSSRSGAGNMGVPRLVARMINLRHLSLDYPEGMLPELLRNTRSLRSLVITITSRQELDSVLGAIASIPTMRALQLLLGHAMEDKGPLNTPLMQALSLEKVIINGSTFRVVGIAMDQWIRTLLKIPRLRHLEINVTTRPSILSPVQRIRLDATTHLQSLILSTGLPTRLIEAMIASATATLSTLVLMREMDYPALFQLLQLLATCSRLKVLKWTGLCTTTRVNSPSAADRVITLQRLESLHFTSRSITQLRLFLSMSTPNLMELTIGGNVHEGTVIIETEELRKFLRRAPLVRAVYVPGIFWPYSRDVLPPVQLPNIEKLVVTTHTLASLDGIIPLEDQRLNLVVYLMNRIDSTFLNAYTMPSGLFACLDTLTIEVRELFYGRRTARMEGFEEMLPFVTNLRVIRLPIGGDVIHLDILCRAMLNGAICPKLEEIYSMQYPDWNLLLNILMMRNIPHVLDPTAQGPVALKLLAFPRQLHPAVHNAIQAALKGYWVPPLAPWVLPEDMQVQRCEGCLRARIHNCLWSEHSKAPQLRPPKGYCNNHRGETRASITKDAPILH